MNLSDCMGRDWPWIAFTIALDLAVAAGYVVIAMHWWQNQRLVPASPAKRALARMRNIFIFCGLCGYIFIPIKMWWPAWRLYDLFMLALVYFTWRYAWGARELKVLYSELNRSTRLESDLKASRAESQRKSVFLNAVSHDLRTPLNGMTLQAQAAEMSVTAGNQQAVLECLAEIKATAHAAAELLNRFLELGRLDWQQEPNRVASVSLRETLGQLVRVHQVAAAEKGMEIRLSAADDVWVQTDRMKVERILSNLLNNAIKFSHSGHIHVEFEQTNGSVRIDVADSGVGIAPDDQNRLFDEFFQVHNHERDARKGFGLGLAISKRLADQIGAQLALVESAAGRGSRFRLTLQAVAGTSQPLVKPPSDEATGSHQAAPAAG